VVPLEDRELKGGGSNPSPFLLFFPQLLIGVSNELSRDRPLDLFTVDLDVPLVQSDNQSTWRTISIKRGQIYFLAGIQAAFLGNPAIY
jgi:hypothetical protein